MYKMEEEEKVNYNGYPWGCQEAKVIQWPKSWRILQLIIQFQK